MIWDRKHKQWSFCKQPVEWWIYATPFNSYTRKFGFERDSASPFTNLTARHCKKYTFKTANSGQVQVAQKSWMQKVHWIQWKFSGWTL